MAYNNSERPASRRPARRRRKVCVFCGGEEISYKDAAKLKKYVSERGKILPRRVTGTCAKHQRAVTVAVKSCRLAARFWHSFGNLKRNKATENRESVRLSPKI